MQRIEDKCKQCGQREHGTAACNTVDDDKPIYNVAMDVIENLKAALAEREKNQHHENCDSRDVLTPNKPCNCYLLYKQRAEQAEARVAAAREGLEEIRTEESLEVICDIVKQTLERMGK